MPPDERHLIPFLEPGCSPSSELEETGGSCSEARDASWEILKILGELANLLRRDPLSFLEEVEEDPEVGPRVKDNRFRPDLKALCFTT